MSIFFRWVVQPPTSQGEGYLDNINVGNLPGTLWYLHNEAG